MKKLDNRHVVLGVAFDWGRRKGLDVFIELSHRLPNESYRIVLVGTDDHIDAQLPKDIISIHKNAKSTPTCRIVCNGECFCDSNPRREFSDS